MIKHGLSVLLQESNQLRGDKLQYIHYLSRYLCQIFLWHHVLSFFNLTLQRLNWNYSLFNLLNLYQILKRVARFNSIFIITILMIRLPSTLWIKKDQASYFFSLVCTLGQTDSYLHDSNKAVEETQQREQRSLETKHSNKQTVKLGLSQDTRGPLRPTF